MEDTFHCDIDSVVVRVDRFWVMRPAGWVERLSGSQEGFDSFVSEDEQRSHRSEPGWERLVAAGVADPADDVFAAEFLQIIPGMAGAVLAWALFTECAHANGDIGDGEAVGRGGQGDQRLDDLTHPRLVEIDAADKSFADLRGDGEMLEHVVSDKALIDAA
jgi:hypothetical protein